MDAPGSSNASVGGSSSCSDQAATSMKGGARSRSRSGRKSEGCKTKMYNYLSI